MRLLQLANNAETVLAANLSNSGTTLTVTPGDGAKFPSTANGKYFMGTLIKADGSIEVVKVTNRSVDTFTIVRTAEPVAGSSTAYAFPAGSKFEARLTAVALGSEIDRLNTLAITGALNKSADYTILEADVANLIRVDSTGGTRTLTLPQISTLTDDFYILISKVSADGNSVTVARSSADTINGSASYQLSSQWQSVWLIADPSTSTWTAIQSGASGSSPNVDSGTSSGSETIPLSGSPISKNNTELYIGGVYQQKSTYSLSGSTITAGAVIPSGVTWEVVWNTPYIIGTPSDGAVTTAKIADGAVTTAKIADGAVTTAKIADGILEATTAGRAKMADLFVTTAKIVDSAITYAKLSSDLQSKFAMKNRIINGAMVIDQRNAGASVTPTGTVYTLDRWSAFCNVSSKFSVQQTTSVPAGFTYSLGVTSTSAYSVAAGEFTAISQNIEGYNVADLGWGTANAKTVTLSFWVRSSLAGTFGGSLANGGGTRSYPFTYSIPVANTWTQISITIAGDTTGTWATNNTSGLQVFFGLGCGSTWSGTAGAWAGAYYLSATGATSVVGTSGATLNITGVQLEVGSSATGFEYRQYTTELQLCQRYCPVFNMGSGGTGDGYRGFAATTTLSDYSLALPVTPRVPPTGITASGTFGVGNGAAGANATSIAFLSGGNSSLGIRATTTAGSPTLSQGVGTSFYGSTNGLIIATGCEL